MSHLRVDLRQRAEELRRALPAQARSAMLPLLHLAQEQDGYLSDEGIAEVAELTGTTPADVRGTASFYEMFHLEPVGTYVVGVCTNIACLLARRRGAARARERDARLRGRVDLRRRALHAWKRPSAWPTATSRRACQVNHRYVRTTTRRGLRRDGQRTARRVGSTTTSRATARSYAFDVAGDFARRSHEIADERAVAKAARDERAKRRAK